MKHSALTVSVVLPCLDEAASVAACVNEARAGLTAAGLSGEIIVVDNGSTDGSARKARDAGAHVVRETTPGYGAALRRGIDEAHGQVVVMADADGTYDLERLGELVAPITSGNADLVIGSRRNGATRHTMPVLHRFVGTPILSFLVRRASGVAVQDSQSGFRAIRTEAARRLGLRSSGMEFASEMLIKAGLAGLEVEEQELGYRRRIGESKLSTLRDGLRHLQLILMMAPQMFLFWPGIAVVGIGLALSAMSFVNPAGIGLGALRWQPVFFAPILVVLGTLSALGGAVIGHHSPLARSYGSTRFDFVSERAFARGMVGGGMTALLTGLGIDLVLFVAWITATDSSPRTLALAGFAQSLVITGGIVAGSGFLYRMLVTQRDHRVDDITELVAAKTAAVDSE